MANGKKKQTPSLLVTKGLTAMATLIPDPLQASVSVCGRRWIFPAGGKREALACMSVLSEVQSTWLPSGAEVLQSPSRSLPDQHLIPLL